MKDLNPTTRMFPRTTNDAFPQDAGPWFERPPRFEGWRNKIMFRAGVAMWLLIIYIYWRYF